MQCHLLFFKKPQQAEFLLLRLLVSHYRQSLDGQGIFQEIYGYLPQSNLEQSIATNLAGIRTKYFQDPEPNTSDLRGFGLMGIYLLTGILPGQLRISRETGEIFWYQYAAEINPDLVELIDQALYCSGYDRLLTGQHILNTLQHHLKTPNPPVPADPELPRTSLPSPKKAPLPASRTQSKSLIYGNLVVVASIALGLMMARQLWQPQPVTQLGTNSQTSKTTLPQPPVGSSRAAGSSGSPNLKSPNLKSPVITVSPSPDLVPTQQQLDPFVLGSQQATQAVKVGKTAQSRDQWQQASKHWQQAIQQMQAVPTGHNSYQAAQNKVKEYQRYQASVQAKIPATPANLGKMTLLRTIRGNISPKSIVYSGAGLFFAQNMMYRHTITVYDRSFQLVKTIGDRVQLTDYGHKGYPGSYQGAPVEAAFSHQGKYAWVSNYQMFGAGFNNPGRDVCNPKAKYDPSFVYRFDTGSLQIDRAIKVGAVPKYIAVSPDDRYALVTNWCSWDLSIIDTQKSQEVQRLNLGAYPRGIAIDSKSQKAYIAVMGSMNVAVLNLQNLSLNSLVGVGNAPRHVSISPDDQYLYVSFNGEGRVGKIDLKTGKIIKKISTGRSPRSMTLSGNGEFLYVVNYDSHSFSKVRTKDMEVIETINVDADPIGITYDSETNQVWVACYTGSIWIFQD